MRERIANAIWDFIMGYPAKEEKLQAIASLDLTQTPKLPEVVEKIESNYNINGRQRPERWSKRKKELEAASRQKRRRLESFREAE